MGELDRVREQVDQDLFDRTLVGDDVGQTNVSAYGMGVMGYWTPNIDRIAKEGMLFTDYYAEQSCTAGRASFITGQAIVVDGGQYRIG